MIVYIYFVLFWLIYNIRKHKRCFMYFLADVIGRVHELGDVQTVQVSGENRKRVQFRLVDAEFVIRNLCFYIVFYSYILHFCLLITYNLLMIRGHNIACCLWGTYVEQLEPFTENTKDQTIVCLIRFAKISFFRGMNLITI